MTTPAPSANADRLNGWKEIAAHLGKGPRTAQRWEKEYGLPVHRVGREGGEIVFAFRDEIDRWSRRAAARPRLDEVEPPEADAPASARSAVGAQPRVSLRAALAVAAGVALLAVAAAFVPRRPAPPPTIPAVGLPAAWRLVNGTLTVLDEHERVVFRRDLGPSPPFAASSAERATRTTLVRIVDLDADGRPEVLVMPPVERRADSRLLCFGSDGRLRFTDAPRGSVRFGGATFGEPWLVHGMFVTGSAGGRSVYASFAHGLWFPARLRRLDARGRLLEEYWSNGYVEQVAEVVWRGRKVLLVGGVGNDVKGGSLAIFDPPVAVGSAPSATEEHRCHGCPDGGPAVRLTFPTMCLLRAAGGIATVVDAWTESPDRLTVGVLQGFADAETRSEGIEVFYTFGPDLSLVHVEVTAEFLARHTRLERRGQLDHAFGARDEADMFPVRLFDAAGVRVVKPVSVSR